MSAARRAQPVDSFRRLFAAGGAALVFALTVFAASPALHDLLHTATETAHDDTCPVLLLASGTDLPVAAIAAPIPLPTSHQLAPTAAREIFVTAPHYLRQPERGPPAV
jgi:hypothetical protein